MPVPTQHTTVDLLAFLGNGAQVRRVRAALLVGDTQNPAPPPAPPLRESGKQWPR